MFPDSASASEPPEEGGNVLATGQTFDAGDVELPQGNIVAMARVNAGRQERRMLECPSCGWRCSVSEKYRLPQAPATVQCVRCASPVPNIWRVPCEADAVASVAVEKPAPVAVRPEPVKAPEVPAEEAAAPQDLHMEASGTFTFKAYNQDRVLDIFEEPGDVRKQRVASQEFLLWHLFRPAALVLLLAAVIGFAVTRVEVPVQAPVDPEPIEFLPGELKEFVESGRRTVLRFLSASAQEKEAWAITHGGLQELRDYYANGGRDEPLTRENVVYSHRHSDYQRRWLCFKLTDIGKGREIPVYVLMERVPRLHWPVYIQEKHDLCRNLIARGSGAMLARVGLCRASQIGEQKRVAVFSPDGGVICYADLTLPDAEAIYQRLDWEKPEAVTVTLTAGPDRTARVTAFTSWGFDEEMQSGAAELSPLAYLMTPLPEGGAYVP